MKEKCRYTDIWICGVITLIFAALKITGAVNWEWLVVFSPIIAGIVLKLAALLLTLLIILYRWRIRK